MLQSEALAFFKRRVKPGDTIWTQVTWRNRTGTARSVRLLIVSFDVNTRKHRIFDVTYQAACLLDRKMHETGGIVRKGCGMDYTADTVYLLGQHLWPKGCKSKRCPSDASRDGGFALRHTHL